MNPRITADKIEKGKAALKAVTNFNY